MVTRLQVGLHAMLLLVLRSHSQALVASLFHIYALFYVPGTLGAMMVPIVGTTPLTSLEHLLPLSSFLCIGALHFFATFEGSEKKTSSHRAAGESRFRWLPRQQALAAVGVVGVGLLLAAIRSGLFSPLSMRVRALFMKHTRTGNPLVDSVAEHSPTSTSSYWRYLDVTCYAAPLGGVMLLARQGGPSDSGLFLLLLGVASLFFSAKMARLIVLLGCPVSALSGVFFGAAIDWALSPIVRTLQGPSLAELSTSNDPLLASAIKMYNAPIARLLRLGAGALLLWQGALLANEFYGACDNMARYSLSHTQVVPRHAPPSDKSCPCHPLHPLLPSPSLPRTSSLSSPPL